MILLSLVYVKVFHSSRQEFQKAEAALSEKRYALAIQHYERAMLWYLPVGGYVGSSAERLWHIAEALEATDQKTALSAYRALRSAFYATRSFYTPGQSWIDRANEKIARLMAGETQYSEADRAKSLDQKTKEALEILKRPMKPDPFWSMVLVAGFLGWVSGVLIFIWRAFRGEERAVATPQGIVWGSVIVLCYALWILGMAKA
ncbi:MAG: hypothetical protein ACE5F7_05370 [Nitrospiria bacterium]